MSQFAEELSFHPVSGDRNSCWPNRPGCTTSGQINHRRSAEDEMTTNWTSVVSSQTDRSVFQLSASRRKTVGGFATAQPGTLTRIRVSTCRGAVLVILS